MQMNCLKHGVYYPAAEMTFADCPRCRDEQQDAAESPAPDLTTLEREVVDLVEAWCRENGDKHLDGCSKREKGAACTTCRVVAKVRALRQARQPKGVKPSEVEPGTRFRFVAENKPDIGLHSRSTFFMCVDYMTGERWCVRESDWAVNRLEDDHRIIPLNPQEPA